MASEPSRVLVPVLLTLTVVTGLIDAVSYLGLGHVFTANMTGNVVLLGFAAAGTPGLSFFRSGLALVAFVVGAAIGGRMAVQWSTSQRHFLAVVACGIEAVLLAAAMAVSLGAGTGPEIDAPRLYAVIGLTGLAMGVRNATVRKLGVADLTTTVLTLAIAGLGADLSLVGGTNVNWGRRLGSVLTLLAGAALGAWFLRFSIARALGAAAAISGLCALVTYFAARHEWEAEMARGNEVRS
jgi:uncharacterized membrane protein YoaK (UPF0700 family)